MDNNLNNKNVNNNQANKPLPEVFKELKAARNKQFIEEKINANKWSFKELREYGYEYIRRHNKFKSLENKISRPRMLDDVKYVLKTKNPVHVISYLLIVCVVIFILGTMYSNYIYAADIEFENETKVVGTFERNENAIDIEQIIEKNSSIVRKKEVTTEKLDIEFEVIYEENPLLPKGEEVIILEGVLGQENVTYINSFENDEIIESKEIKREIVEEPVAQYVDIGTSEFLAKYNAHIGDTMYLAEDTNVWFEKDDSIDFGFTIPKCMDVTLKNIDDDWYLIRYEDDDLIVNGYIKEDNLRSATSNPEMPDKARIHRIANKFTIDSPLNKKSGFTEQDFVNMFTGMASDKNKIFENNALVFYNLEQKYNINGIFIAAIGIHESGWGTSKIAADKNNLFGYGAYDSSPYESAYHFETYEEGIETLAKSMAKYYLNEDGVQVTEEDVATGIYYNGPTLKGVNTRYASDQLWHEKIFNTMEALYNRIK